MENKMRIESICIPVNVTELKEKLGIKELSDYSKEELEEYMKKFEKVEIKAKDTIGLVQQAILNLEGVGNLINFLVKDMGELKKYQVVQSVVTDENVGKIINELVNELSIDSDEILEAIETMDFSEETLKSFIRKKETEIVAVAQEDGEIFIAATIEDLFSTYKDHIIEHISDSL